MTRFAAVQFGRYNLVGILGAGVQLAVLRGWPARLVRFHLGNGVMSMGANVALTFVFHEFAALPVMAANVAAMVSTALLNFGLAKYWVFRDC